MTALAKGRRTWRTELAYQCGRAIVIATAVAGFELISVYLGGAW